MKNCSLQNLFAFVLSINRMYESISHIKNMIFSRRNER